MNITRNTSSISVMSRTFTVPSPNKGSKFNCAKFQLTFLIKLIFTRTIKHVTFLTEKSGSHNTALFEPHVFVCRFSWTTGKQPVRMPKWYIPKKHILIIEAPIAVRHNQKSIHFPEGLLYSRGYSATRFSYGLIHAGLLSTFLLRIYS
jgi:hypothetical protein